MMLNPGDNRTLGCFVKEARLDNDFKLALYPRWHEASDVLTREICKAKELYFKTVTDPRIRDLVQDSPLDLFKLHHDLAQLTDKWTEDFKKLSKEYADQIELKFLEFAKSLDPRGRLEAKVDRCFKPYVLEAENKRSIVFESFQRNLIDGLLWEQGNPENRRVEDGQPPVVNGPNHEAPAEHQYHDVHQLTWDDYTDLNFASSKSAVEERNPERPVTETGEDDQVSSVN